MKIKVLFSDMDYTLYRPLKEKGQKGISLKDQEAIKLMQSEGFHFVVTTGRFSNTVFEDLKEVGLKCDLITSGGSAIYINDELIYIKPIDLKLTEEVFETVLKINPKMYFRFADEQHFKTIPFKNIDNTLTEENLLNYRQHFKDPNITPNKISISFKTAQELDEIKELLISKYSDLFFIEQSTSTNLDLTQKGVHKGTAIQYLLDYYGLKKEEAAGIGDGQNDLAIFNDVYLKFAMNNAVKELKEEADYIVNDIDEAYRIIKKTA